MMTSLAARQARKRPQRQYDRAPKPPASGPQYAIRRNLLTGEPIHSGTEVRHKQWYAPTQQELQALRAKKLTAKSRRAEQEIAELLASLG